MKRTRFFVASAILIFFFVVGAYSKQREQLKQQQQEQIETIGRELDRLARRAGQLAGEMREAKAVMANLGLRGQ